VKEPQRIDRDVFVEESSKLTNVLALLTKQIQNLIKNKPYPDVNVYSVGWDYEERQDLQYKKECNSKVDEQIATLKEYEDSPYFARMDFRVSKETVENQVMYIGKKGLNIDSSQLVYDWRSPIGKKYYMKSMICFDYNGFDYSLQLRRSLEISQGILKWYHDEYVQGDELFNKGVTDPFLVDALRAKRADHKLTDIIKTIQENQNAIINYPASKSFIVQGCAGSGKTMILLHRLSQIIFNNPKSDLSKIKIITPNTALFGVNKRRMQHKI
jgi:DNA helicase IV